MALDTRERTTPKGAETDRAFEEMMSKPDMQALNDQGDAAIRDNLNAKEQNPSESSKADEDIFGYLKNNGLTSDKAQVKTGNWLSRHKKGLAGGGTAIITIAGFFSVSMPLKLQGIFSMVQDAGMGRIEGYIEKRAKRIVLQAVMNKVGGIKEGRGVVKSGSLMGSIVKTMTASKYEERLAAKGIEFIKDSDGVVKVRAIDRTQSLTVKTRERLFRTTEVRQVEEFLDGIPLTKSVLRGLIKEDLGAFGFLVRGKMVRWMYQYLGVRKLGADKPKDTDTTQDKIDESAAKNEIADSAEAQGRSLNQAIDNLDAMTRGSEHAINPNAQAAEKAAAEKAISETVEEATAEMAGKNPAAIRRVMQSVGEKFSSKLIRTNATKAVPVYGEVVMVAQAKVIMGWIAQHLKDGSAFRALAAPSAIYMSWVFSKWAGLATQGKIGELDERLYNFYVPFLDGIEESGVFDCYQKNWQSGCGKVGKPFRKLNEKAPAFMTWLKERGLDDLIFGDPRYDYGYWAAKLVVNVDNFITDKVIDLVLLAGKPYLDFYKTTLQVASLAIPADVRAKISADVDEIMTSMSSKMSEVVMRMFGLSMESVGGGANLLPMLANGATYTANRFAESSLGLHVIDSETTAMQTQRQIAEKNEYIKSKGMAYALFSPEVTTSITSRLTMTMSYEGGLANAPSNVLSSIFGLVKNTPRTLASAAGSKASAASTGSPEEVLGIVAYGITDEELDRPIHDTINSAEPCKDKGLYDLSFGYGSDSENTFDTCLIDTAVSQSILCSLDTEMAETSPDCNPDIGGASESITAGTGAQIGDYKPGHYQCAEWIGQHVLPDIYGIPNPGGNGKDIAPNLGKMGYTVDHTPAVHAIVSFPGNCKGCGHGSTGYGHVAVVYAVNADGSIEIEDYNGDGNENYTTSHVNASVVPRLQYAHVEAKFGSGPVKIKTNSGGDL